jgi:hypothetical protein
VSDFQKGADASDDGYDEQECADVKKWLKRIEEARKFDEGKRKQIAIDRRYADGDAGNFDVPVDLCGSYVDILKSILWARNPDLSIQPAESVNPPPMADVIEMARNKISMDPATHQMMEQFGMAENRLDRLRPERNAGGNWRACGSSVAERKDQGRSAAHHGAAPQAAYGCQTAWQESGTGHSTLVEERQPEGTGQAASGFDHFRVRWLAQDHLAGPQGPRPGNP